MNSSIPEIKASITASLCGFIQEWQEMIGQAAGLSNPARSAADNLPIPGELLLIAGELIAAVERSVLPPAASVGTTAAGGNGSDASAESGSAAPPAPNPAWNRYVPNPAWQAGSSVGGSGTTNVATPTVTVTKAASPAALQSPALSQRMPAPAVATGVSA